MNYLTLSLLPVFLVSSVACAEKQALPANALETLENAASIELFSLSPRHINAEKEAPKDAPALHGYRILGRTTIEKAKTRGAVISALKKGIAQSDGSVAGCFNPRHGLAATHNGTKVELVICFECLSMNIYIDGKQVKGVLTTSGPQRTFDQALTDAKVPLVPGK